MMREAAKYEERDTPLFNVSVPGESLTQSLGQYPYEQPPEFNTPKEALNFILDRYYHPVTFSNIVKVLAAGVPIELIVDTLVFTGFLQGKYTVDVAELIKPALFLNIIADARDTDLEPVLLSSVSGPEEINSEDFMDLMKTLRPEEHAVLLAEAETEEAEQMMVPEPEILPTPLPEEEEEEVGFIEKDI